MLFGLEKGIKMEKEENRISWVEYYLSMAEVVSRRATCLRRRYGAILVDQYNQIISTGYNGAPRNCLDCLEKGTCWRKEHNIPSGQDYDKCLAVHAETNALLQAGKRAKGAILYLYGYDVEKNTSIAPLPCISCARMLVNAGVDIIVTPFDPEMISRMVLERRLREMEEYVGGKEQGNDLKD